MIGQLSGLSASVPRATVATAVRFTLQLLEARAPGQAVEVRVPPFGAVQILPGTTHRRGTPPAVVEMSAEVWLALAVGILPWSTAISRGLVAASGNRADLGELLPLRI
ncbi:sterol carrier family protein [Mobiluncus sp.]|uniref:sterol carrier family protein n=1 Tax=Mobiluncus sp. TaxID=47293 RepID=UPI0039C72A4D